MPEDVDLWKVSAHLRCIRILEEIARSRKVAIQLTRTVQFDGRNEAEKCDNRGADFSVG